MYNERPEILPKPPVPGEMCPTCQGTGTVMDGFFVADDGFGEPTYEPDLGPCDDCEATGRVLLNKKDNNNAKKKATA